jgi:hypothetical protein
MKKKLFGFRGRPVIDDRRELHIPNVVSGAMVFLFPCSACYTTDSNTNRYFSDSLTRETLEAGVPFDVGVER